MLRSFVGDLRGTRQDEGRENVTRALSLCLAVVVCTMLAWGAQGQVHYKGYRGLPCYADTTDGWEFGLTGEEFPVSLAIRQCEVCGLRPSPEEVNTVFERVAGVVGRRLIVRDVYFNWRKEQERVERLKTEMEASGLICEEMPVEWRYLGCFLRLPDGSMGLSVALTRRLQVSITAINRGGATVKLNSKAVYATDDHFLQNYCWKSTRDNTIRADPDRLFSKTNRSTGRTSIILLAMFEDRFKEIGDIEEVKLTGLQIVKRGAQ